MSHDAIPKRSLDDKPAPAPAPAPRLRAQPLVAPSEPSTPTKQTVVTDATTRQPLKAAKRASASKTVYFNSEQQLMRLEAIAERFPRCTVSAIVQQLVNGLLANEATIDNDRRQASFNVTILF